MRTSLTTLALAGLTCVVPAVCAGQQRESPLEVGVTAPDFSIAGATRFGTLQDPVRLSDYRGKAVVLAFFFRARTPG